MEEKKLPMGPGEIVRDYLASKTPMKQIQVLAQLNACSTREIVRILEDQGAPIPKNYRSKAAREDTPPPPPQLRPRILTAGSLRRILERVPEDTPVQILGSGVATAVNFLERFDAGLDASSYVLELQREEVVT